MATLQSTSFQGTERVTLPSGNTGQRSTPELGMLRYNNTSGVAKVEFYDGNDWRPVTGFSQGAIGTGGNSTYYRNGGIVHVFTSGGTFTPAHSGTVQVLVVGGGGGSGFDWAGAGGGGGVIYDRNFPVTGGSPYTVTVGDGGARARPGQRGQNSVFGSITALGGGGGGSWDAANATNNRDAPGPAQGSGGGGSNRNSPNRYRMPGGYGQPGQGFPGGSAMRFNAQGDNCHWGGGGGGAGGPGEDAPDDRQLGANVDGGPGMASDILGHTLYWGGGGAGGAHHGGGYCNGGLGGGGGGSIYHGVPLRPPTVRRGFGGGRSFSNSTPWGPGNPDGFAYAQGGGGANNTGGGGGGGQHGAPGGSGIVIVRY